MIVESRNKGHGRICAAALFLSSTLLLACSSSPRIGRAQNRGEGDRPSQGKYVVAFLDGERSRVVGIGDIEISSDGTVTGVHTRDSSGPEKAVLIVTGGSSSSGGIDVTFNNGNNEVGTATLRTDGVHQQALLCSYELGDGGEGTCFGLRYHTGSDDAASDSEIDDALDGTLTLRFDSQSLDESLLGPEQVEESFEVSSGIITGHSDHLEADVIGGIHEDMTVQLLSEVEGLGAIKIVEVSLDGLSVQEDGDTLDGDEGDDSSDGSDSEQDADSTGGEDPEQGDGSGPEAGEGEDEGAGSDEGEGAGSDEGEQGGDEGAPPEEQGDAFALDGHYSTVTARWDPK